MENKLTASQLDTNTKPLTAKESAAVEYYTNAGSDTYNDWCNSYKKANYSTRYNGWKAEAIKTKHKPHIKQAIEDNKASMVAKLDVTVEFIVNKLLTGLAMAETKQDLSAMARFSELLGRYKTMFTDKVETNATIVQHTTPAQEQAQLQARLARLKRLEDIPDCIQRN